MMYESPFRVFSQSKNRLYCENNAETAKAMRKHTNPLNYFLRFSKKIFSDFWPQAKHLQIGRRPSTPHRQPLRQPAGEEKVYTREKSNDNDPTFRERPQSPNGRHGIV
jgi:hypothetical protein